MLIERLEFIGYGSLTGQRIEFGKNKLSVVVQPNEYGKSTISEAIWSVIYDYPEWDPTVSGSRPGVERKPLSGATFKACVDLLLGDRNVRLIRNFSERSLKVLDLKKDLGKAGADITSEFADAIAADEFGLQMTGLTRELFRSTCVISQRQLDRAPFSSDRGLPKMLLNIADSGGIATNVFEAIAILEDTLAALPFKGKTHDAGELLESFVRQREALVESIKRLEGERQNCDRDVEHLSEIEDRLHERAKAIAADEYFQLCLESGDIESRLTRAHERLQRFNELTAQLQALAHYEYFPIDRKKYIEELWMKRIARQSDLQRLETEIKSKNLESQMRDLELRERGDGLADFSVEESQTLSSLARSLHQLTGEIEETRKRRDEESQRVKAIGVNLDSLANLRRSLLSLEPKELDDAHAYHAMIIAARDRTSECERSADKARTILKEINEQRYVVVTTVQKVFWPSLFCALLLLLMLLYYTLIQHMDVREGLVPVILTLYVISCFCSMASLFAGKWINTKYRWNDENSARQEEEQQLAGVQELADKAKGLDGRIAELARKAGLNSAQQLLHNMQEYAVSAAQLKELDLLDHMVQSKESHAEKLRVEIEPYFKKAQRPVKVITAREAYALAEALNKYLADQRRAQSSSELRNHRESEVQFLSDELKDTDRLLSDTFQKCGLKYKDVEEGFFQFCEAVDNYKRWENLRHEVTRMAEDNSDLVPSEMPRIIERLEAKRADLWARMRELVSSNPDIANMPPPLGDSMITSAGKEMSDLRSSLDEMKAERDQLIVQIRAAMMNFQDNYLKAIEELEQVEADLAHVERSRTALLLARDNFLRLAEENHSIWADKLTDISREMLKHVGTEYEALEFDADMTITVRRKGQREPLNDWHITRQLSTGTREQLHWLARMAVIRFLSKDMQLPIILDEPFSEFDDERFVKIMRFLINTIARHHQVIIFSCHQHRQEWLMQQLEPAERECVELCKLTPMKADAGAFARR